MTDHSEEGERYVFLHLQSSVYCDIQQWHGIHNVELTVTVEKTNLLIFHLEMQNY